MKKILFALFLIFVTPALRAQSGYWEKTKGPNGGFFNIVNTINDTLYAQHIYQLEEIYRSTNGGETWEKLTLLQVPFLNPSYIGIGATGTIFLNRFSSSNGTWICYRTNNYGQSWSLLAGSTESIVETQTGTLFGIQTVNLVRSTNGGQSWETSLVFDGDLKSVHNDPYGGLLAIGSTSDTSNVILHSVDEGQTWDTIRIPFDFGGLLLTPMGTILCTKDGKLLRSSDGGQSFNPTVFSGNSLLNAMILSSGRILFQNVTGTYYSDDEGISWQVLVPFDQTLQGDFLNLSPLASGKIFKLANQALYASTDGGITWQFSGTGMGPSVINCLKFVTDSLYYASTDVGMWKTENAGESWEQLSKNFTIHNGSNRIEITSAGGVVLVQDGQLFWSANGSIPFEDITPFASLNLSQNYIYLNPANNHFFTNSKQGVERSQDYGQSWELVFDSLSFLSMAFHPSGRIIATSLDKKMYVSNNNGSTWQNIDVQNIGYNNFIKIAPNGDLYRVGGDYPEIHLWKSTDVGQTWIKLSFDLTFFQYWLESFDIAYNGHLYLFDHARNLFISTNGGLTWQSIPPPFSDDLGPSGLNYITISPNQYLYAGSEYNGLNKSTSPVTQGAYIEGHVRVDADADCSTPDAQAPLKNRIIEAEGESYNYFTNSDPDGHYIFFVDTGAYQVSVQNPSSIWWDYCEDSISVNLPELFVTDTADFVAIPLSFCPLMTVNVAIPILRRCFDNEVYVEYCNQGTEPADSAWVDVMLDPYLSFVSSAQPHEVQPNNTFRFFVGDIPSGECGQFQLTVHANCDSTVLGQTHCVTAHGFPDTLCTTVPNWSGANIEASVTCQDTTLQFHLKNTGSAPSQILDFIIIEDDIVLFSGQEGYDIAEDLVLDVAANGSTWRIESEQEPGHPFSTLALAFAEGCGGFNSLGYINQFTVNGITPSWHRMCVENTGSYDPNDKQGFPTGTGSEHNIRPGQTIDYLIRFQNTGTDTAFTVVVRDTLSPFLDPLNIRPGASSHPYTWSLSGQGVITFSFNNIMLPDSNVNEQASHGFVQFSIAPYPEIPLGSVIENSAAIYFDFNQPVITNTTWHTIEKSPLSSALHLEPKNVKPDLEIWPNPFNERTNIHVGQKTNGILILKIYDSRGTLVTQKSAVGPDIELSGKQLPVGLYWLEVQNTKAEIVGKGKLLRQ